MKGWLFVISLALIAHQNGVGELLASRAEAPHVAAVLAIKCEHLVPDQRAECVDRYERAFGSGDINPLSVLRMHCTRWQNQWESSTTEPPSMCVEHFGGWVGS